MAAWCYSSWAVVRSRRFTRRLVLRRSPGPKVYLLLPLVTSFVGSGREPSRAGLRSPFLGRRDPFQAVLIVTCHKCGLLPCKASSERNLIRTRGYRDVAVDRITLPRKSRRVVRPPPFCLINVGGAPAIFCYTVSLCLPLFELALQVIRRPC